MDEQAAIQQAMALAAQRATAPATGAPVFNPPVGMGSPALGAVQPPPPPVEEPASGAAPPPADAAALVSLTPTEDLESGPNADEEDDRELDDLGYGDRPIQGPAGHSDPKFQHPLDRAADTIRGELQQTTKRMATALFPQGPADSVKLSNKALLDYIGRHWNDPSDPQGSATFRQSLLDRVAPKGPDGTRLPSGVKMFHKLYHDAIVKTGKGRPANAPQPEQMAAPQVQLQAAAAGGAVPPGPPPPLAAPPAPPAPPAAAPPPFVPPGAAGVAGPVAPNQLPPGPPVPGMMG
jgi:hypothetical protein